jgi:hypothetical protein
VLTFRNRVIGIGVISQSVNAGIARANSSEVAKIVHCGEQLFINKIEEEATFAGGLDFSIWS